MADEGFAISARDALACATCTTCLVAGWILYFLTGAYRNQPPLYRTFSLIVALLSVVGAWWEYARIRRKLG